MAALMAAVIVRISTGFVRVLVRETAIVPRVCVGCRRDGVFGFLGATKRVHHCRVSLEWDQQQEREDQIISKSASHGVAV